MAIRSFGYGTDVGISRKKNEDNFCVAPEIGLWAVADGMGGHKGGKTASRITVKQLAEDIIKGIPLSENPLFKASNFSSFEALKGSTDNISAAKPEDLLYPLRAFVTNLPSSFDLSSLC